MIIPVMLNGLLQHFHCANNVRPVWVTRLLVVVLALGWMRPRSITLCITNKIGCCAKTAFIVIIMKY